MFFLSTLETNIYFRYFLEIIGHPLFLSIIRVSIYVFITPQDHWYIPNHAPMLPYLYTVRLSPILGSSMSGTVNSTVPIILFNPLVRRGATRDPRKAATNAVKTTDRLARLVSDLTWVVI